MNASTAFVKPASACELRFLSLFGLGRGYSFPCDERGRVDLDAMSERQRNSYYFARALVGRDLMPPKVQPLLQ
jgi:hypothetical protein